MTPGLEEVPAAVTPRDGADPKARNPSFEDKSGFMSGLPFDPSRLVAAWVRRSGWILLTGIVLAVAAGAAGHFKLKTQYQAVAQLMRQESAGSFRASEVGEPFKPRQMSVPTLVGFIRSSAFLERVAAQSQVSVPTIASSLTITPERNTDLIIVRFNTAQSPQSAVRVLNSFGQEVVRMTRDMQSQEAAEMNRLLRRQLAQTDADLMMVNHEVLAFSKQADLINADKEIDAYLRTLGELDMRYETARIAFETLDLRIEGLEQELAANNPLTEKIQVARERLAELLQQYTEANPLVSDQLLRIKDLESQLAQSRPGIIARPRQGESGLATTLYADLSNLRTQKKVTAAELEKLKAARSVVEDKLRGLPEKGMQLTRFKARQQSLEAAQALLASRQREAQVYEDNAPGYYRFFESKLEEVAVVGRRRNLILFAMAGGVFGLVLAVGLVGLLESHDDRIKTAADARRVTGLPLLGVLREQESPGDSAPGNWAFKTWLALRANLTTGARNELVCGVAASSAGQGCSTWVEQLGKAASLRGEAVIVLTDRAPKDAESISVSSALSRPDLIIPAQGHACWLTLPPDWCWDLERRSQWCKAMDAWSQTPRLVVLVELAWSDRPETLLFADGLPQQVWLVGSGIARSRETDELLKTYRNAGCRFAGVVLNREKPLFPWS